MLLSGWSRPLSELEDLELRRDRLKELVRLELVSPSLSEQIVKAVDELDRQITAIQSERQRRHAA